MQHLIFRLGAEHYALATREIERVLPVPAMEPLAMVPPHVAGLFRYQGQLVPALDLNVLLGPGPSRTFFSSRLIVVATEQGGHLGLIVEQAMEIQDLTLPHELPSEMTGPMRQTLNPVVYDSNLGMIQTINWHSLLTPELMDMAGKVT